MDISEKIKVLRNTAEALKEEADYLERINETSGAEKCVLYIMKNHLEYIQDEIKEAWHEAWIAGLHFQRNGGN